MEPPAGTKDMGDYTRRVFTPEQQARLGVDEDGQKLAEAKLAELQAGGGTDILPK